MHVNSISTVRVTNLARHTNNAPQTQAHVSFKGAGDKVASGVLGGLFALGSVVLAPVAFVVGGINTFLEKDEDPETKRKKLEDELRGQYVEEHTNNPDIFY